MEKPLYEAQAYSIEDIMAMLRSQGLEIEDEDRARYVLMNVSYSRLKNYLVSLMYDRAAHRFKPGSTFEHAYALYGFDRRLRELIFHEMEKIEISIRTRMAYASNGTEKGYWFLNPAHFKKEKGHENILKHLRAEIDRSDNESIRAFKKKYSNEFPPSWLALEAVSIGTLATIYDELADGELRKRIAAFYDMSEHTFYVWVRHLVWIRNNCAHHNRVWNSVPSVKACLPEGLTRYFPPMKDQDRYHIYMTLCILKYFLDAIKPTNTFAHRLKLLVGNFPMITPSDMGFPTDWESDPLWR